MKTKIKNLNVVTPILIGYNGYEQITIQAGEEGYVDWSKEAVESMVKRKCIEVVSTTKKKEVKINGN